MAQGKSPQAFRTISEVAELLGVQQHVLRFWESKFSALRPLKRGGNRRYYRAEDVALLRAINRLLYTEGYTIRGVQKLLEERGASTLARQFGQEPSEAAGGAPPAAAVADASVLPDAAAHALPGAGEAPLPPAAVPATAAPGLSPAHRAELSSIRQLIADGLGRTR